MERSEQIGDLAGALAKAQGAIKGAAKGKANPFYKSSYADLACVMDACREALSKNNIAYIQSTQFDADNKWIETLLVHSTGQWVSSRYPVKPVKDDPQGMGSAVTYARRYSLMALVGIVAEDEDDDGNAASGKGTNGAVDPLPPLQRPKQIEPSAAAAAWAKAATESVTNLKTSSELRKWELSNEKEMARLKVVNRDLWRDVNDLIAERMSTLSELNA